jgi:hypothetical protein
VIVKLSQLADGQWCEWHYDREGDPGAAVVRRISTLVEADGRYPLRCRRCPKRNTRVTPETLSKALDGFVAAGFDSLDLAHFPF